MLFRSLFHTFGIYVFTKKSDVITPPFDAVTMISLGKLPFGGFFNPLKMIMVGSHWPVERHVNTAVNLET